MTTVMIVQGHNEFNHLKNETYSYARTRVAHPLKTSQLTPCSLMMRHISYFLHIIIEYYNISLRSKYKLKIM